MIGSGFVQAGMAVCCGADWECPHADLEAAADVLRLTLATCLRGLTVGQQLGGAVGRLPFESDITLLNRLSTLRGGVSVRRY